MAVTVKAYGHACAHVAQGNLVWATDTMKLALCTSAYTPDQGNNEFFTDLTNELAASGGYTAGGFALSGKSASYDATTREYRFDAADFSVAALTPSSPFRYGIVYKDTGTPGTSWLLCYLNFGADQDPGGLPFAIQWAATGVCYLVAS